MKKGGLRSNRLPPDFFSATDKRTKERGWNETMKKRNRGRIATSGQRKEDGMRP